MNPESLKVALRRWQTMCRWLLGLLTLVMLASAIYTLIPGIKLDTNLRSLSPSFSDDLALNQTLNRLSSDASRSVILVLTHEDQDRLDEISDFFQSQMELMAVDNNNLLEYPDQSELLKVYSKILQDYPFNFLGKGAEAALTSKDQHRINQLALANLYGNASSIKLIDIEKDPFGFMNEYAVSALENLTANMQIESRQVEYQGKKIYIAPQMLTINIDSLSLAMQKIALQQIHQLQAAIKKEFPDVQLFQTGMIFFAADSAQSAQADINLISIGSTIGVILLLLLIFRSIKAFFLPIISIGLGVCTAFFICHSLFGSIHILTVVFGASLIGVVVDYSLHYFYFCVHQKSLAENKLLLARSALNRALLFSLVSSVVGYVALAASGLTALMQVAIFSAVGLIYAWLFVVVFGQRLTKNVKVYDATLNRGIVWIISRLGYIAKPRILFVSIAVLISLLWFDAMPVNDSPKALINNNPDLIAQEQLVNGWVSSYEPASFILVSGDNAQQVYDRIAKLEASLSKKSLFPESARLLGVNQFLPSPKEQENHYELNGWMYQASNPFAENFIQQQGLDVVVNLPALQNQYRNQANKIVSPTTLFEAARTIPSLWIEKKLLDKDPLLSFMLIPKQTDIAELKKAIETHEGVRYFSAIEETQSGLQHLRESALKFLILAIVMIGAILCYQYQWKKTLHLIAIPVMSICGSLLLLNMLNIPLTLFHVMALFLVLGLGMDYVVFVAEMTSTEIESANDGDFFPAIVLSAMTNMISFGLLALSSMPAVNAFGITLLFGCSLNLLGAFWLAAIWRKTFLASVEKSN